MLIRALETVLRKAGLAAPELPPSRSIGFSLPRGVLLAAVAALGFATPAQAGPIGHVWHYVSTHKELLATDTLIMAGQMADAASTVHCIHYSPYCTENNPALPLRPTNAQLYIDAGGIGLGVCAIDHLLWHFAPRAADRQIVIFAAAPIAIGDALQTKMNVDNLGDFEPKGK